jgi:hypothetical protein
VDRICWLYTTDKSSDVGFISDRTQGALLALCQLTALHASDIHELNSIGELRYIADLNKINVEEAGGSSRSIRTRSAAVMSDSSRGSGVRYAVQARD